MWALEPSEEVGREPCVVAEAFDTETPPGTIAFRGSRAYVIGQREDENGNPT